MKKRLKIVMLPSMLAMASAAMVAAESSSPTNNTPPADVAIRMTVTAYVESGKRAPQIEKHDVFVKSGNNSLPVSEWVPARGERAGLELFFLIDDAATTSFGSNLADVRAFIEAQPPTTVVGVGYARNATVDIRQNLTSDHELAGKALRMPVGSVGAFGSPYLSLINLMKRWPDTPNRREVILVTDGIDRAGRGRNALFNPDVDTATALAQRTGTIVHTIYFPGAGHWRRNFWEATNGQNGISKLSDITGGESFFLGREEPVNLLPFFRELQRILDNQYLLTFSANAGKKAGLQRVSVGTEVAGVDFNTPDAVWVPAR